MKKAFQSLRMKMLCMIAAMMAITSTVIEVTNYYLIVKQEQAASITLVITFLFVSFTTTVFYFIIRRYIIAVENLSKTMKGISNGDLSVDVVPLKGKNEISTLISSFNEMMTHMRMLRQKISKTKRTVSHSSEQLLVSMEETKTAVTEVTMSIQDIAAGSDKQLLSVVETEQAMVDMAKLLQKMTDHSSKVQQSMNRASEHASTGNVAVKDVTNQMNKIYETVKISTSEVKGLEDRSTEIGRIIDTITRIAEQTNLLALNAAIEAARAGEHGKGFAVVAGEVRKLAEESKTSAIQISHLLKEIEVQAKRAYQNMEVNREEVTLGISTVEDVTQQFSTIMEDVFAAQEQMNKMTKATGEIDGYSFKVMESVMALSEVAKQAAAYAEEVAAASQEELASIEELVMLAANLKATVSES
ncbi:HAMP domain-containing methyl-accepting chemotaxis protein [Priestia megaterium]|uniref:Methyl-accepting chemotaxis protein n=1 Tax=Priestia megaterium TaxID=1404 RepID=A0AAX6BG48_PRIMG|nr:MULTISPECIES: HAMP domain-containing methyl-accepting chemotaxis protein [Priestia]MBK0291217.1 methyl-accepting chemotaxis protein [Bacillus sp. S34]MDC7763084.1 HAMP domain-containing methyl-accepting chemotaxis protein [Priestia aryabhattai]MEB4888259.1 HAMP domain-containing methyl-accepting chemotaxis protein [Priestia megaterium]MED5119397.1 HAMP domain-containing methyl-accepting chemotaxis protein [Priestia megaterium]WKG29779.1 HAMP domain-containing methyl-accepting chemotaxis pro